jgi:hypothetical protein
MFIRVPAIPNVFDEHHYKVPVYSGANNTYNMDPVRAHALKSLADEYASHDPDLHKHFIENGTVEKTQLTVPDSSFLVTAADAIEELDNFDEVQGSVSGFF